MSPKLFPETSYGFAAGMQDSANPTEYASNEVALLLNGRVSFDGNAIERRMGSQKRHATALNLGAQGYGGIEYFTAAGTQQIVVFVGNTMYYSTDEGVTWTQGATTLREDYWSFAIVRVGAENILCCANGAASVYTWNGTTWGTATGWPSGVKYLAMLNDRLMAAGHSGDRIKGSGVQDVNTQELDLKFASHDGDVDITGLYSLGGFLLAFKRKSVGYLDGFGFHDITVQAGARGVARSVGCIAHRTIHGVGENSVMWLSERGFEHYTAGGQVTLVSRPVQQFIDTADLQDVLSAPGQPVATYWTKKNEYVCAFGAGGTGANDYRFRYRPGTGAAPACIMLDRPASDAADGFSVYVENGDLVVDSEPDRSLVRLNDGALAIATGSESGFYVSLVTGGLAIETGLQGHEDTVLFTADQGDDIAALWSIGRDGYVRRLETGNMDDADSDGTGGLPISMRLALRPMVWGDPQRRKRVRIVRVSSQQDSAPASIEVTPIADGLQGAPRTLTMPITAGRPVTKKTSVDARGHAISLELRTTDNVLIAGAELRAHLLVERV